jgi:hypothetical protein
VSAPPLLALVRRLTDTTADALDAALELRARDLQTLDRHRADLVFELQLELQQAPGLEPDERAALHTQLADLQRLEDRLARVARLVSSALRPLDGPPTPALYAPNGTLRG